MRGDGITNPKTGKGYFSIIQLRQDNFAGSMYNMVGFQTRLTYPEQEKIFKKLPGLENAEFFRFGSMHRNSFINAPQVLNSDLSLKANSKIFIAGQFSGVEGYIESTAQAIAVAYNIKAKISGSQLEPFPDETAIGSLVNYITKSEAKNFQPMKINFGIFKEFTTEQKKEFVKGRGRYEKKLGFNRRAMTSLQNFLTKFN